MTQAYGNTQANVHTRVMRDSNIAYSAVTLEFGTKIKRPIVGVLFLWRCMNITRPHTHTNSNFTGIFDYLGARPQPIWC